MIKGTPLKPHEYRGYPIRSISAVAHHFGRTSEIFLCLTLPGMHDMSPDHARELIAVLAQFIADAEAS